LPAPVPLKSLLLAPAERADLIVDFAGGNGRQIVPNNDFVPVMQFRRAGHGGGGRVRASGGISAGAQNT